MKGPPTVNRKELVPFAGAVIVLGVILALILTNHPVPTMLYRDPLGADRRRPRYHHPRRDPPERRGGRAGRDSDAPPHHRAGGGAAGAIGRGSRGSSSSARRAAAGGARGETVKTQLARLGRVLVKHEHKIRVALVVLGLSSLKDLVLEHERRLDHLEGDGRVPIDDVVTVRELDGLRDELVARIDGRGDTTTDGA